MLRVRGGGGWGGGCRCDRKTADWLVEGLKRCPEVAGMNKPLFSKVTDAARQRVFIVKTHLDGSALTWREEAGTQGRQSSCCLAGSLLGVPGTY